MAMTHDPARTQRRLMTAIALGLLLVMPCAVALQTGAGGDGLRVPLLAALALGTTLALAGSLGLTGLQLRAATRPGFGDLLHDELSMRNSVRAMAMGYVVAVGAGGFALPLAVWLALPAVPLLTAVVLAAVVAHAASFAWFERQGDDGGDD